MRQVMQKRLPAGGPWFVDYVVTHHGGRQGLRASAQIVQQKGPHVTISRCSWPYREEHLADMPRFARKRVAAIAREAQSQLEARSGPAWDLVRQVMEEPFADKAGGQV
jgi:hypothetical protein